MSQLVLPYALCFLQATGEAVYVDDMPSYGNELHAEFVLSTKAHAVVLSVDAIEALMLDGVHSLIDHRYFTM